MAGNINVARKLLLENPELAQDSYVPLSNYLRFPIENIENSDDVDLLALLVEHGADINACPEGESVGIILQAARRPATRCVKFLLEHGANINASTGYGSACGPLKTAVMNGYLEIVKMLVQHGANFQDWGNDNALTLAIYAGQTEIAVYLRSIGARDPIEFRLEQLPPEADALTKHLTEKYGLLEPNELIQLLPMNPPVSITVVRSGDKTVFVTRGMSAKPIKSDEGRDIFVEVLIQLPRAWPIDSSTVSNPTLGWPIQWLYRIAHFAHSAAVPLGFHATIPNAPPSKPLSPETDMSSIMLFRTPSNQGRITMGGKTITLYQILPVFDDEVTYSEQHGIDSLLEQFETYGISQTSDMERPSVVDIADQCEMT